MINEIASFKALETVIAIGIVFASYRIQKKSSSEAWERIALAGTVLAVGSITEAFIAVNNVPLRIFEGIFAPSLAVLLSGASIAFLDEKKNLGRIKADHMAGFCFGVVIGLAVLGFIVPSYMAASIFYLGTPFLLLPAIYSLFRLQDVGENLVFDSMLTAVVLYFLASMMNIYLSLTCFYCNANPYKFIIPASIPGNELLVGASLSSPAIHLTATIFLGYSLYLQYHETFPQEEDTKEE